MSAPEDGTSVTVHQHTSAHPPGALIPSFITKESAHLVPTNFLCVTLLFIYILCFSYKGNHAVFNFLVLIYFT